MKEYLVIVKGDTNDADFIYKSTELSEEEYSKIKDTLFKVSKLVNEVKGHNWGNEYSDDSPESLYVETGLCTEEELEVFQDLCPYGEYGVHTIYDVVVYSISERLELV